MKATDFDWCEGITSKVQKQSNGFVRGHLLMLDMDDVELETVRDTVEKLPDGYYIVQRSSENCYNVVSLNSFDFFKVAEIKSGVYYDDSDHLKIGLHRDKWVTRLSPKGDKKSAPEFVEFIDTTENAEIPVSGEHVIVFTELYDGLYDVLPAFKHTVDTKVESIKYPSLAEREEGMNDLWRSLGE